MSYPSVPTTRLTEHSNEHVAKEKMKMQAVAMGGGEEEKEEESKQPVSRFATFKLFWRRIRAKFSRSSDADIPMLSPDYLETQENEDPRIVQMLKAHRRPVELFQEGFTDQTLTEHDISLNDLQGFGYTLQEIKNLFPTWVGLRKAGFNKYHLRSKWYFDTLSTLYEIPPRMVGEELEFNVSDYIATNNDLDKLQELQFTMDTLLEKELGFEQLFALRAPINEYVEKFGMTKQHLVQMKLNETQLMALAATCGWNVLTIVDELKITDDEEIKSLHLDLD